MIKISFTAQSLEEIEAWQNKGPHIIAGLVTKTDELMIRLQKYIQEEKLEGQVLQHRTGQLSGSVRALPTRIEGKTIIGDVVAGGGVAPYAKYFETVAAGGTGGTAAHVIYPVTARALHFFMGGAEIFAAYVFHPGFPAKPFISTSLEEMRDSIVNALQQVFNEGMAS